MNSKKKFKGFLMFLVIVSMLFSAGSVLAAGGDGSGGGGGGGNGSGGGGGAGKDTTEIATPEATAPAEDAAGGDGEGGGQNDPLTLVVVTPESGAQNIAVDTKFDLEFSKNVVNIAVKEGNQKAITLWEGSNEIPVELQMADDQLERERRNFITVVPKEPLAEGKTYTLKVDTTMQSKSGTPLSEPLELSYTTLTTEKPMNMTPIYLIIAAVVIAGVGILIMKKKQKS